MRTSIGFVLAAALLAMAMGCEFEEAQGQQGPQGQVGQPVAAPETVQPQTPTQAPPKVPAKVQTPTKRPTYPPRPARPAIKPPPGPQPRVVFDHKKFDFKTAIKGDKVTHAFTFKNEGESDLKIERVQPSCGCVAAPLKKTLYTPGESGEIEVSFDSSKKNPGLQRFTIAVHSNDFLERDRGVKISVLELKGDVIVFFKAVPPQFYLQKLYRGETVNRQATLQSTGLEGEVLTVEDVIVSNPDALKVEVVSPSPKAGTGPFGTDAVDLILSYTPVKVGPISETVTVKTGSKKQPEVQIMLRGMVEGDLRVTPPTVYVRNYQRGRPLVPNAITIRRTRGDPTLKVLEVQATMGLTTSVQQVIEGKHYAVRLALDEKHPSSKPFAGEVRIFVNSEDQPMVKVPVVIFVTPSVQATPEAVYFKSPRGAPYETRFSVRNVLGKPFELSIGDGGQKHVTAEIVQPQRRGYPYQVILRLKPDTPPGELKDSIVLRTTVPGEEELVIPVNGVITE